jgi:hypothetical protein
MDILGEGVTVRQENGATNLYFVHLRRDSLDRWVVEEM